MDGWGTERDVTQITQLSQLNAVGAYHRDAVSVGESGNAAFCEAGHFDIVINNAGDIGYFGPAESLSAGAVHAQFQTVVFAHIELCRLAVASMRAHGAGGRIINVTSLAARLPVPFMGAYNAAKAAMASFTMSMQLELEGSDVRVIDVQPGDIHNTKLHDAIANTPVGDGPHTARMERVWHMADRNIKAAPGPELVSRRIANLIGAANPPPRVAGAPASNPVTVPGPKPSPSAKTGPGRPVEGKKCAKPRHAGSGSVPAPGSCRPSCAR